MIKYKCLVLLQFFRIIAVRLIIFTQLVIALIEG